MKAIHEIILFIQKCDFADVVFNSTPNTIVIFYNFIIRVEVRMNEHKEALKLYHLMIEHELQLDK